MEFKNKDQLVRLIAGGRTQAAEIAALRQQVLQLAQVVDEAKGTRLAPALAAEYAGNGAAPAAAGTAPRPKSAGAMERSRKQSREAVQPR